MSLCSKFNTSFMCKLRTKFNTSFRYYSKFNTSIRNYSKLSTSFRYYSNIKLYDQYSYITSEILNKLLANQQVSISQVELDRLKTIPGVKFDLPLTTKQLLRGGNYQKRLSATRYFYNYLSLLLSTRGHSTFSKGYKDHEGFMDWFRGFSDAEGCFYISKIFFCFKIKLHLDDIEVLHRIQKKFNYRICNNY
uniref:GIY-YIG endonuclease n=1 Tax=Ophiocordyceps sinensis TaxID=72228 RepID=A0A1W5T0G9_9HYPO|nr:GIY-YIG endonuclease [Ophiocordyceps sinensis]ARF03428.1 GIY-YIG endonuclease [Ophiocordyceps sinensis]QDH07194.1 GIY-YIG endonuclease [Ophiocordyceps sinensis]